MHHLSLFQDLLLLIYFILKYLYRNLYLYRIYTEISILSFFIAFILFSIILRFFTASVLLINILIFLIAFGLSLFQDFRSKSKPTKYEVRQYLVQYFNTLSLIIFPIRRNEKYLKRDTNIYNAIKITLTIKFSHTPLKL